MKRGIAVLLLATVLGGCAHKQPTNRQVAIGVGVVVGLSLLLYLAVSQCNKGANFCDNEPNPQ